MAELIITTNFKWKAKQTIYPISNLNRTGLDTDSVFRLNWGPILNTALYS